MAGLFDIGGKFKPRNVAGVVQLPCRYAVQSALDALGIESLGRVLQTPGYGPAVRELLLAHGGTA